eukprot:GHVU01089991.1.p4 GENE.GHVU01089991.1~~GHVU01089991.1.p4  ORF type:complete len:103 (+),score=6.88 GHVU01089991.1:99-407(+)
MHEPQSCGMHACMRREGESEDASSSGQTRTHAHRRATSPTCAVVETREAPQCTTVSCSSGLPPSHACVRVCVCVPSRLASATMCGGAYWCVRTCMRETPMRV